MTVCLRPGMPWFNYWFSFTLAYSKISHEYSSLLIIVINLIFMFCFDALTELGAFMRTEFLCISVLRVASGPRVKLVSCKSALNPSVVCSTARSKALVPVLVLLFLALWFILQSDLFCLTLRHFVLVFFSHFSIAITSLGEERANLSAFRTFVRYVLVWICRFPFPLDVWEGLRFVIVALPELFSYPFFWLPTILYFL